MARYIKIMPEEVEYDERIEKMIESGEAYEVEKILDKRRSINVRHYELIKE